MEVFYSNAMGLTLLGGHFASLLTFESQIVEKANNALKDVQKFLVTASTGSAGAEQVPHTLEPLRL